MSQSSGEDSMQASEACTAPYPLAVAGALRRLGGLASVDELASPSLRLGERRRIQRGVSDLVERGLALRDNGTVVLSPTFKPANVRGVGVEAKMGRWRKAVRQTQMWRHAVNGAWLLFPATYLTHVPRQRPGMRSLGLAAMEETGAISVIRQPRLTVGRPATQMLAEEHLYARWRSEAARKPASPQLNSRRSRSANPALASA